MSVDFEKIGRAAHKAVMDDIAGKSGPISNAERLCLIGYAAGAAYLAQICGPTCDVCPFSPFKCQFEPIFNIDGPEQYVPGPNCPAVKKEG